MWHSSHFRQSLTMINETARISSNFHYANTADDSSDDLHHWSHTVVRAAGSSNEWLSIHQHDPVRSAARKVDASNACIQSSLDLSWLLSARSAPSKISFRLSLLMLTFILRLSGIRVVSERPPFYADYLTYIPRLSATCLTLLPAILINAIYPHIFFLSLYLC